MIQEVSHSQIICKTQTKITQITPKLKIITRSFRKPIQIFKFGWVKSSGVIKEVSHI